MQLPSIQFGNKSMVSFANNLVQNANGNKASHTNKDTFIRFGQSAPADTHRNGIPNTLVGTRVNGGTSPPGHENGHVYSFNGIPGFQDPFFVYITAHSASRDEAARDMSELCIAKREPGLFVYGLVPTFVLPNESADDILAHAVENQEKLESFGVNRSR